MEVLGHPNGVIPVNILLCRKSVAKVLQAARAPDYRTLSMENIYRTNTKCLFLRQQKRMSLSM